MHPLLRRRLRPIAAVVLVFFTWFSIEPWNFALAAQGSPTLPRHSSAPKPVSAAERFETDLRAIKERVRSAREGDAFQAQLTGLLASLEQAAAESSRELEASRRVVDGLARALEQGAPSQEAIKALRTQEQLLKAAVGKVRLNAAGIEGLLRGMVLPAGLTKDQQEAKNALTTLAKTYDAALAAMVSKAEQGRGFDVREHQTFLTASMELDQGLAALRTRVQAVAKEATPERRRAQLWQEAFSKRDSVLLADREIRKEFDQTEAFLKEKGLPQEILDRHEAVVRDYERNFSQLKTYFFQVDRAHRAYSSAADRGNETAAQNAERDLESNLSAFDDFLKANVKDPPHQPLDPNNLPHRTQKPTERKPRFKKEEFAEFQPQIRLAYNGDPANLMLAQATTDLPTPADLAETIEVQFTPEIQALAAELEHNPVKIYNWVRNNIDFVPTYGSIQGAHMCLLSKRCNDMDTASLLISLLRISGIGARYVIGTVTVPIERFKNWVGGFSDAASALRFVASSGTPVQGVLAGAGVIAVRLEHVWIEAYVDYIPSRGAAHKTGDSWVPLDPSYKQYEHTAGLDFGNVLGIDVGAVQDQLIAGGNSDDLLGKFSGLDTQLVEDSLSDTLQQAQDYFSQNLPSPTGADIVGGRLVALESGAFLPAVLGYEVVVVGARVSQLPEPARHRLRLSIRAADDEVLASLEKPLAEVGNQRLTLGFAPSQSQDLDVLWQAAQTGGDSVPAYLVKVIPEFRIDGTVVETGPPIGLGVRVSLELELHSPVFENIRTDTQLAAGSYASINLDLARMNQRQMRAEELRLDSLKAQLEAAGPTSMMKDDLIGEFLRSAGLSYWAFVDVWNDIVASMNHVAHARQPSVGVFSYAVDAEYLFGVPSLVVPSGLETDVDVDQHALGALTGDDQRSEIFMRTSGFVSSAFEPAIYDLALNGQLTAKGVSTVHIFAKAAVDNVPVYTMNQFNSASVAPLLQVGSQVRTDIENAIAAGLVVIIPETPIVKDGELSVGYVVADPRTGSSSYRITGGFSGGRYKCACIGLPGAVETFLLIASPLIALNNPYVAAFLDYGLTVATYAKLNCQINNTKGLCAGEIAALREMADLIYIISLMFNLAAFASLLLPPGGATAGVFAAASLQSIWLGVMLNWYFQANLALFTNADLCYTDLDSL